MFAHHILLFLLCPLLSNLALSSGASPFCNTSRRKHFSTNAGLVVFSSRITICNVTLHQLLLSLINCLPAFIACRWTASWAAYRCTTSWKTTTPSTGTALIHYHPFTSQVAYPLTAYSCPLPVYTCAGRPKDVSAYSLSVNGKLGRLVMDHELKRQSGVKRVLLGHSIGSICAVLQALEGPDDIEALVGAVHFQSEIEL